MMDRKQINDVYEESVWQIRLKVAISLLAVPGLSHNEALAQADQFVGRLMKETLAELNAKFP